MVFDDLANNGQTQSDAKPLCAEHRFEYLVLKIVRNTDARVGKRYFDASVIKELNMTTKIVNRLAILFVGTFCSEVSIMIK